MSRVDFFLSTRKTKVGLLIELSTMVPLDHAVLNGKVVGSHQAYGIPVPGGARAGGRGAPVGEPSLQPGHRKSKLSHTTFAYHSYHTGPEINQKSSNTSKIPGNFKH